MNIDETKCPKCNQRYSEKNPPRLLTMCGHTYCENCIKQLITKKKFNHKFRLVCPTDGSHIQLNNANPTFFPKNLSIANLVKNKAAQCLTDTHISVIQHSESSVQYSNHTIQAFDSNISVAQNDKNIISSETQDKRVSFFDNMSSQTCLLHQKALQIVCVKDCRRICPSCVIFGQHRGHKVKNLDQVQKMIKSMSEQLTKMSQEYEQQFRKLSKQQISQNFEKKLNKKKQQIHYLIKKKFKEISELVSYNQKKSLSKAEKKINSIKSKFQEMINQKANLQQNYSQWQTNLNNKLRALKNNQEEEKYQIALRSDNFVNHSKQVLLQVKNIEPSLVKQVEKMCDSLTVVFDQQQVQMFFKEFCKIQSCENSFLEIDESRISYSRVLKQQSLLDDIDNTAQISVKSPENPDENKKKMKTTLMSVASNSSKSSLSRLKSSHVSSHQNRYKSPTMAPLTSSRCLNLGSSKNILKTAGKLKRQILPEKYDKNIQQISSGFTDVLDLTSGELGDDLLYEILQSVKEYPLTIVKLVKNKLTDSGFLKIQGLLQNSVMLNLSKNQLTSKTLEQIIKNKQSGKFVELKSIMLGQNKIQQRKHRHEVEKLRKLGVNICM